MHTHKQNYKDVILGLRVKQQPTFSSIPRFFVKQLITLSLEPKAEVCSMNQNHTYLHDA